MPRPEDAEGLKVVRKELARRAIDISLLNVHFSHGIVHFTGQVKPMRGHNMNVKEEMETLAKILKARPQIKDVVLDCVFRT